MINHLPENDPILVTMRVEKEKAHDLRRQRSAKQKELEQVREAARQAYQLGSQEKLEREAACLLQGIEEPPLIDRTTIQELSHSIEVFTIAIEKQQQAVDEAARLYSREMNKLNEENYLEIEKEIFVDEQSLGAKYQKENDFIEALRDAGVAPKFQPMRYKPLGVPNDRNSFFSMRKVEFEKLLNAK